MPKEAHVCAVKAAGWQVAVSWWLHMASPLRYSHHIVMKALRPVAQPSPKLKAGMASRQIMVWQNEQCRTEQTEKMDS